MNILQLTRKTTSDTNRVSVDPREISYISETKGSTTIHLKGYNNYVIVEEKYNDVIGLWLKGLEN